MLKRIISFAIIPSIVLSSVLSVPNSYAVTASDWVAGNIIDDSVFTDANSMSVSQIQAFLNMKVGTGLNGVPGQCDIYGTRQSEWGGGTRAEYGAANNNPIPYTCLKDFYEVPKTSPGPDIPANNYGGKPIPNGAKSAAELIWDAAQMYNISPKVLLVKLGTESAGPLTSDDWPFLSQYTYAMGAHCPDSGPGGSANCDPDYSGFSIQISEAAKLLRWYLDNMNQSWWTYKKPYQTNSILWNVVESGCGAGDVYIGNNATAALYTYTPYQPNQAALNNMYGKGDGCSAYGNRNFWRTFSDWFGTVRGYVPLQEPRWMEVTTDTYKKDPATGENIDFMLNQGLKLKFVSKIYVNGKLYLRTEYDDSRKISKGILFSDLKEIPYEPFITPRYMKVTTFTHKRRPSSGSVDYNQPFYAEDQLKFVSKILIDGKWYYRSEYDTLNNNDLAIPASAVTDIDYLDFEMPRYMEITNDTYKLNAVTGVNDTNAILKNSQFIFDSKIYVNKKWYYRVSSDTSTATDLAIDSSYIKELPFEPYGEYPKWLQLKVSSKKVSSLTTTDIAGSDLLSGKQLQIADKIFINGKWYYRTSYDSANHNYSVLPADNFEEIPFVPMDNPREIQLRNNALKVYPKIGLKDTWLMPKAMSILFTHKIYINGIWYLRTSFDTSSGYFDRAVSAKDLYV